MKKLFTIFLIAIFGLLVVACTPSDNGDDNGGGNGDTDTTAPVFSGLDPATVDQGVAFDPREGVTATDDVDGDVTADIEIEGEVDVDTVGEYVLTYRVSDQAGNERVDDRRVEVVPMANLKNGDFSEGLAEWDQYHPTSIPVTFSAEDGEALIDIEELPGDNEWWNVQLQYNQLNLKAFFPYILEFTVRAENNRYMNHQIQGGGLPEKAYGEINLVEIGPEAVTVTKEFYVRGPGVNSQLQLSFGNFGPSFEQIPPELRVVAGKVWVSNVKITQGEPLENQPPVLNAPDIYVKPGARSLILSGVTVSDDRDFLDITDVQWTETTVDGEFNPENPEVGVYTFDLWVEDSEGLRTEVSRTIYVVEAFDLPLIGRI